MKWLQNILLGCLISLSVSYVTITVTTLMRENRLWTGEDLLEEVLLALVLGAVIGAATLLFEIERWSYRFILLLHFVIIVISVYVVGAVGGWYDITNPASLFYLLCEIIFIYIIVWIIMLLLEKREIEKINRHLKRK